MMNTDVLVALLSGTGLATLVTVFYRIWKERRANKQQDIKGDLTLGELFRDVARREVLAVQHDMEALQEKVRELRAFVDHQEDEIHTLHESVVTCEARYATLLSHWPPGVPVPPAALPD